MKKKIANFRRQLGLVFDDDPDTKQWHNIIDHIILLMVVLSSVEIFVSTFNVPPFVARILNIINQSTLWFFVVEVTLRIWAAPEQDAKYSGLIGRLRYCTTFYGLIDFVSTYPFLVQFFLPLPTESLKVLRTARIIRVLRITRYAKSFNMISTAIREKRNELIVSIQFLAIVTFMLSLVMFIYEHGAQPETYDNGFRTVVWAFAQYIGDPGQFADTPPITLPGKIIACIVGILGIAIFAIPAGILGAGFTETIEKEMRSKQILDNHDQLLNTFERNLDRVTGYRTVPFFRSMLDIQASLRLTADDIVETVGATQGFRLVNLASTIPIDHNPHDRIAVEHFAINRPYGQMIDRNSDITIVSPSSMTDATVGIFSYYLAAFGGFNYISREIGATYPYRSYYIPEPPFEENLETYNADLQRLLSKPGAWSFTVLAASGSSEPEYDTQVHIGVGGAKGDETLDAATLCITDKDTYRCFYAALSEHLQQRFEVSTDQGRYHTTAHKSIWFRQLQLPSDTNHIVIRIAWSLMLWSKDRLAVAKTIADDINRTILRRESPINVPDVTEKKLGF